MLSSRVITQRYTDGYLTLYPIDVYLTLYNLTTTILLETTKKWIFLFLKEKNEKMKPK